MVTLNFTAGVLNPEQYPAIYTGTSGGQTLFSNQQPPIEFYVHRCDLYKRFGIEVDKHLVRINQGWGIFFGFFFVVLAAAICGVVFGPVFPIDVLFVCTVAFLIGMCCFSAFVVRRNKRVDNDLREVCLAFGDEFRRTTGYSPEYRRKIIRSRRRRKVRYIARVFVFVPVEAGRTATATSAATTGTAARTTTTTTTTLSTATPIPIPIATATTATTRIPITTEAIEQLLSMGFEEEKVAEALRACNNDVERAADHLVSASTTMATVPLEAVAVLMPPAP